jgi:hypothetical protein
MNLTLYKQKFILMQQDWGVVILTVKIRMADISMHIGNKIRIKEKRPLKGIPNVCEIDYPS